ncbi:acetylornithine deacetylase [Pseudomonadota bacterium]
MDLILPTQRSAPTLMQMMHDLIAAPSMSSVSPAFDCSNNAVIELLASWLENEGFSIEISQLPNQPNKSNLIATLGEIKPNSQGLMLAGHTDTVPYDEQRWQQDPFKLVEKNQRLYGLGTSDMKSFFALAIEAARQFEAKNLKHPLVILATADEESSMEGAQLVNEQGCPYVSHAIVGEPTGLRPVNAHKGMMMEAIRLTGQSGHSSDPSLGLNAMEAMHKTMADILAWRDELQSRYRDDRFIVSTPTLNLGHIHGGDNPNRICGGCELHFDLRPLPGMALAELRAALNERLTKLFKDSAIQWQQFPLFHGTEAMHTHADTDIVKSCEEFTNQPAETVAFCTEGPYLADIGINPIILGPGDIAQAHQPNEFLALDRLQPTINLLTNLIRRFCT